MRQIRNGVFETNSSSVHSICIQKDKNITLPNSVYFGIGEYGWEFDRVDTASYLYTAILSTYDKDEAEEKIKQIKTVLDKHSISYYFEEPAYHNSEYGSWLNNGYVDHDYCARDFIDAVLNDEDLLLRCLFGAASCVYTGNDNSAEQDDMCYCADETVWDDEECEFVLNPNHVPNKYDYFYKGN